MELLVCILKLTSKHCGSFMLKYEAEFVLSVPYGMNAGNHFFPYSSDVRAVEEMV